MCECSEENYGVWQLAAGKPEATPSGRSALHNWKFEALVFSTNFRTGFDIPDFQAVLPKNLIHHMVPGEPIYEFFDAWKGSAAQSSAMKIYGPKQWFVGAAELLAQKGYKINLQKKFLSREWLIWEV